jgi:hypothetical protein
MSEGARRLSNLHERTANVLENKGSLWKIEGSNGNVYDNKGSYSTYPGMYMETGRLVAQREPERLAAQDANQDGLLEESAPERTLQRSAEGAWQG